MKIKFLVIAILIFSIAQSFGQSKISYATYKSVLALDDSVSLNKGKLKLYNIFKAQVKAIYENQNLGNNLLRKAVIEKTYRPFKILWAGYVGDSAVYFDEVIMPLLNDSINLIETKTKLFSNGHIDKYFNDLAFKMQSASGNYPKGKWYIVFGSGVTDLGGFGGGVMVLDLTHNKTTLDYTKFILPHELTHQVFDFTNKEDTTAKGLYRCINEGFAVYVNEKLLGKNFKLYNYLQYSDRELNWCLQNEGMIFTKLKPFLLTNNSDHAQALADRGQIIFKDGPGAIGYFIGYRICEAYVTKNGKDSWKDIFSKPVKEILEQSGYNLN